MDEVTKAYKEEAYELLGELEESLLELEERPDDMPLVERVFRAMHTIKGSSAMFGFQHIADFTHEIETVFDLVRDGHIAVTNELINLTLQSRDQILEMLETTVFEAYNAKQKELLESYKAFIPDNLEIDNEEDDDDTSSEYPEMDFTSVPTPTKLDVAPKASQITYRIRFKPNRDLLKQSINPVPFLNEIRELGECNVVAQTHQIPDFDDLDPELCYTFWDIILTTDKGIDEIKDIFLLIDQQSEFNINVIDEGELDEKNGYKKLGEILTERRDVSKEELDNVLNSQKRIGQLLLDNKMVDQGIVESALAEQKHVKEQRQQRSESVAMSSIRVAADKLDRLVDLVGELVTVQARLTQEATSQKKAELVSISEEVERLTSELRDNTMSIRMLPIGTTFNKFRRLVRDLSNDLGKVVVMNTDGGDTELDKTVIEQLNDPLVHIIRNSIDHGIESPDERRQNGKPEQGTIQLSAIHSGSNVLINIKDDGAGLDVDKIRKKAIERNLMHPDEEKSEKEIFLMIFEPGFSTADKVSGVSGRGVGMDVVKRCIEALRGTIQVHSDPGVSTTITLKLPLTLAIIEGLLVKIGEGLFVVPLLAIEECVELPPQTLSRVKKQNMMNLRDEIVPFLNLRELFLIKGDPPPIEQIVITEAKGEHVAFGVDHVVGQIQTVIKTLGKMYKDIEGISGATILGDGTVALILDVVQLVQTAERLDIERLN
ncbi:MAG: chemotaxis protein CheA [Candidatus Magnetomorum sp.]|nr:chemotaxis protein CheA [Candidatus Magnetomorum sp.]